MARQKEGLVFNNYIYNKVSGTNTSIVSRKLYLRVLLGDNHNEKELNSIGLLRIMKIGSYKPYTMNDRNFSIRVNKPVDCLYGIKNHV